MILYLMRHGIASDESPSGRDADRPLTAWGIERTTMMADRLAGTGLRFDGIVSSPYVRANQTAAIMAGATGFTDDLTFDDRLVPFARYEDVSDIIAEHRDAESLLLVGHEPSMGRFIGGLCGSGPFIEVKKASVTAIEIVRMRPQAGGFLLWSLTPKLVEGLSGRAS